MGGGCSPGRGSSSGGYFELSVEETDHVLSPVEFIRFGEGIEIVVHDGEEGLAGRQVDRQILSRVVPLCPNTELTESQAGIVVTAADTVCGERHPSDTLHKGFECGGRGSILSGGLNGSR